MTIPKMNVLKGLGVIGMIYGGWIATVSHLDERYVRMNEYKTFETKEYIRNKNRIIDNSNIYIQAYQAKIITEVGLTEWERVLYDQAVLRKAKAESDLKSIISPPPLR